MIAIMKKKVLVIALLVFITGVIGWSVVYEPKTTDNGKNQQKDGMNVETVVISPEKPESFNGVEMVTYKSPYYGITYPKEWVAILTPEESRSFLLESYAIYPKVIPYGPSPILNISVSKSSAEEYFKNQASIENLTKVSLNDSHGYRHTSASSGLYDPLREVIFYVFPIKENLIRVEYWPNKEYYDVSEEEALWVLSTFKIAE